MTEIQNLSDNSAGGRQKASSLADRVYHLLFSRISSGDYPSDQRLPSENELASEFDVSRPIVRDALERLRKDGLIYSRQGAGSFVRTKTDQRVLGFSPVETIADIQRCYEFRLTIEPDAAFYAARRRNDALIARIEGALDLLSDATRQQRHREDADFAFHVAVSEASNNHYYSSSMQALKNHIAVGMKLHGLSLMGPQPGGLQHVLDEHRAIFEAVRDGDAETARAAMRGHLEGSRDRLFEGKVLDLSL
ncbi:FadR/GntR family transcriptional regulator [Kaistia dalseonensis]|uniref:DNA-binding FadR family transcriptional regulator n=1 Tax=Kaistia dalseonensis TaxID=410840 RepID=A0ABU0HAL1_9HYPH|nr:FadR/GntR family transcriptional regulator [Kaistia dalseonensis]MCX5496715.1 FadR/GntR family transcriptional regulator [Kaistia dalseonensis]MDQ0439341.1 DNA-binding FadR family transcriptional regulator [Kaistia dalseonensis]